MRIRLLILTASIVAAPVARGQTAGAAIDKAVAAWADVRTAKGTFEQTVTNSLLKSSAVAHANFQQQRPNKLSVRFTDTKGDAIVSDGKYLWLYFPTSDPKNVLRRPAADRGSLPVDPGQFLESPRSRYDIADKGRATLGGRVTRAVLLTPKKGATNWFVRATVWIDEADGLIRQFEVVEDANLTRKIQFTTLTTNGPIDEKLFTFVAPAGVKIIDDKK
jgi:outer membrane lipoprotein-sorting protein